MAFQVDLPVGRRSRFRDQEFWAEGGLVCIENRNTGNFKALMRAEAAARAIALNAELEYMAYPDERDELSKCVCELCEAIKEAKRQGDPEDPAVRRQRIKDSRKVSLMISREAIPSSESLTPRIILPGNQTKSYTSLRDKGLSPVVPDLIIPNKQSSSRFQSLKI